MEKVVDGETGVDRSGESEDAVESDDEVRAVKSSQAEHWKS